MKQTIILLMNKILLKNPRIVYKIVICFRHTTHFHQSCFRFIVKSSFLKRIIQWNDRQHYNSFLYNGKLSQCLGGLKPICHNNLLKLYHL